MNVAGQTTNIDASANGLAAALSCRASDSIPALLAFSSVIFAKDLLWAGTLLVISGPDIRLTRTDLDKICCSVCHIFEAEKAQEACEANNQARSRRNGVVITKNMARSYSGAVMRRRSCLLFLLQLLRRRPNVPVKYPKRYAGAETPYRGTILLKSKSS